MSMKLNIVDTTLRDGSHAVRHSFTAAQTSEVAARLERCGLPIIEVSHGDGLGGSSYTYGFSKEDPFSLIEAAAKAGGRWLGTITGPGRDWADLDRLGYRLVVGPSDIALMIAGARAAARTRDGA